MMTQFRGLSSRLRIAPRNLALSHSLPPTPDLLSIPCHAVTVVTTYLYLTMISEQAEENNAVDFVGEFLARSAIHIVFAILKYLVWKLIRNQILFFLLFFLSQDFASLRRCLWVSRVWREFVKGNLRRLEFYEEEASYLLRGCKQLQVQVSRTSLLDHRNLSPLCTRQELLSVVLQAEIYFRKGIVRRQNFFLENALYDV